jgi:heme iron utilization protein
VNGEIEETLREVIRQARVASLGTLHRGRPSVSMVPYALLADGGGLVIHVSRLAAHTSDMFADARVSVLVMARETEGLMPQALPRVQIDAEAAPLEEGTVEHDAARAAYLGRFPEAEPIFGLGDFVLFALRPQSARVIAGFGRAATAGPDAIRTALTSG